MMLYVEEQEGNSLELPMMKIVIKQCDRGVARDELAVSRPRGIFIVFRKLLSALQWAIISRSEALRKSLRSLPLPRRILHSYEISIDLRNELHFITSRYLS